MKRRVLAVLLAGVLAFSNVGAVFAADVSGSGSTDAEETFAACEKLFPRADARDIIRRRF